MKKNCALFLFLLCISVFNLNATKWRVNNTAGIDADFTSFKEAHNGANEGDTLMFEGSNLYYGSVDTLAKKLVIIGPGYFLSENETSNDNVLPAKLGALYLAPTSSGSVVMGMSFSETLNHKIDIDASNVVIERNYIKGYIYFALTNNIQNVVISKNYVGDISTRWGDLLGTGLIISNNIVDHSIGLNSSTTARIVNNVVGAFLTAYSSVVKNNISYYMYTLENSLYEYNMVKDTAPTGTGNIGDLAWNDLFVTGDTSTDGEYVLSETSAAKGAGEGGTDCGIFGGSDPYILSGLPPMPFIYNVEIPTTASGSMTIKINARSQK